MNCSTCALAHRHRLGQRICHTAVHSVPASGGTQMAKRYSSFLVRWWSQDGGQRIEIEHIQSGERALLSSISAAFDRIGAHSSEAVNARYSPRSPPRGEEQGGAAG